MPTYKISLVEYDQNGVEVDTNDPYIYRNQSLADVAKLAELDEHEILWVIEECGGCSVDVKEEHWVIEEEE